MIRCANASFDTSVLTEQLFFVGYLLEFSGICIRSLIFPFCSLSLHIQIFLIFPSQLHAGNS